MSDIADIIYDSLLLLALVLQISVLSCIDFAIPPVGSCVALIYTAWLHSLYCFEYTWIHKGMGFNGTVLCTRSIAITMHTPRHCSWIESVVCI